MTIALNDLSCPWNVKQAVLESALIVLKSTAPVTADMCVEFSSSIANVVSDVKYNVIRELAVQVLSALTEKFADANMRSAVLTVVQNALPKEASPSLQDKLKELARNIQN